MNPYLILAVAILSEVFGSAMLKVSDGFKKIMPTLGVVSGYVVSFYLFSLVLMAIPLSIAYAIWSGVGTALTALIGVIIYKEGFNIRKVLGLVLIIGGVALLRSG